MFDAVAPPAAVSDSAPAETHCGVFAGSGSGGGAGGEGSARLPNPSAPGLSAGSLDPSPAPDPEPASGLWTCSFCGVDCGAAAAPLAFDMSLELVLANGAPCNVAHCRSMIPSSCSCMPAYGLRASQECHC